MAKQLHYPFHQNTNQYDDIPQTFVSLPLDQVNDVDDCFDETISSLENQNAIIDNAA